MMVCTNLSPKWIVFKLLVLLYKTYKCRNTNNTNEIVETYLCNHFLYTSSNLVSFRLQEQHTCYVVEDRRWRESEVKPHWHCKSNFQSIRRVSVAEAVRESLVVLLGIGSGVQGKLSVIPQRWALVRFLFVGPTYTIRKTNTQLKLEYCSCRCNISTNSGPIDFSLIATLLVVLGQLSSLANLQHFNYLFSKVSLFFFLYYHFYFTLIHRKRMIW